MPYEMHVLTKWAFLLQMPLLAMSPIWSQPIQAGTHGEEPCTDTLKVQWSKAEWFGRSKFRAGPYASGKFKRGISSTSHKMPVNGREELMTRMPLRLELKDSLENFFEVEGERYTSSGYWAENNLSLVEFIMPGVQEETYVGDQVDVEIMDAVIRHPEDRGIHWKFHLKRNQSDGAILDELDGFLSNGSRIIQIRGPRTPAPQSGMPTGWEAGYYEFSENGRAIGRLIRYGGIICFPQHTPWETRSLLLAVALAMQ